MENHKKQAGVSSSSSSTNFDHLFGPKGSTSSSSSSSSSIFGSIFSPPPTCVRRDSKKQEMGHHRVGCVNVGSSPGKQSNKGENAMNRDVSSMYQNETVEPCYFSSSIYYGGQENYSQRISTTDSQHIFKKDSDEDDPNGNGSNSTSRGNWWEGSLYY